MQDKWFEKEMETMDEDIWLCQGHEERQEQGLKKWFKFNFKQKTRQDYVIQKQKHKMCKINVKINLYYANMNMRRHDKAMV
jgi:hypothetical protein